MRIVCFDIGIKRVGIAATDKIQVIIQPIAVVEYKTHKELIEKVKNIINWNEVEKIVVGLPLDDEGNETPQCVKIRNIANFLKKRLPKNIKWIYYPEILSSYEMEEKLIGFDISRKKRKKILDKLAAYEILKRYINSLEEGREG